MNFLIGLSVHSQEKSSNFSLARRLTVLYNPSREVGREEYPYFPLLISQ
jgi:hypothetical protein